MHHSNERLVPSPECWPIIGEILQTYLTHGLIDCAMCQVIMTISGIQVLGVFKALERCLLSGWLILADVVRLWYSGRLLLMNIRTGPALPYSYEQNTRKSLHLVCFGEASM